MKLTKFASLAIGGALAFGALNAKALPGFLQFEKLNFDLIAIQQGTASNSLPAAKLMKLTNKDLLNFLAEAFHTNWPAGAQLALFNNTSIILEPNTDIYVVDKTGTNPVFNASTGINLGGTNIAYFAFEYDNAVTDVHHGSSPITAGKNTPLTQPLIVLRNPISWKDTEYQIISFHLFRYDVSNPLDNINLSFQGLDKAISNVLDYGSITSGSVLDGADVNGDGDLDGTWTVINGQVTGAENWQVITLAN
jgi:hypothetical protein